MKPIIIKEWIEVDNNMFGPDKENGKWTAYIFVMDKKTHRGPVSGKLTEHKKRRVMTFDGKTKKEVIFKIKSFIDENHAIVL